MSQELKKSLQMANAIKDAGRVTKVWVYRDEIYAQMIYLTILPDFYLFLLTI